LTGLISVSGQNKPEKLRFMLACESNSIVCYRKFNKKLVYMDYFTIKDSACYSFTEKKSEFISCIRHCTTSEQAAAYIESVRAEHRKAAHNAYAYRLRDGNGAGYSDGGEPQGTAGLPVFEVLKKNELTDVCCVVTRYFGGILLGAGGLLRAYSHSAALSVQSARIICMRESIKYNIKCSYHEYKKIKFFIGSTDEMKIKDERFTDTAEIDVITVDGNFSEKIVDLTNGKAIITETGRGYFEFA